MRYYMRNATSKVPVRMCGNGTIMENAGATFGGVLMGTGNVLTDRWRDLSIAGTNPKTPREAAAYLIKNFMPRYLPWKDIYSTKVKTACNILFTDVVQLLGLDGPYHWVDKKGKPVKFGPGVYGRDYELSANGLVDWFERYGNAYGYVSMSRNEAEELAADGKLVAVMYKNPDPDHSGHIGIMLENGTLAQAGKGIPFVGHPIEEGFGNHPIEFWGYVEKSREE